MTLSQSHTASSLQVVQEPHDQRRIELVEIQSGRRPSGPGGRTAQEQPRSVAVA